MGIIFALLFLIAIFLIMMSYYRTLNSIAYLSKIKKIEIFDASYRDIFHMLADISFHNDLWSGAKIPLTQDDELTQLLFKARKLLKLQIIIGFPSIFLLILISASQT